MLDGEPGLLDIKLKSQFTTFNLHFNSFNVLQDIYSICHFCTCDSNKDNYLEVRQKIFLAEACINMRKQVKGQWFLFKE